MPGTNVLDWRKVHSIIADQLVSKIIEHSHEGVKPGDIPAYAKVSKLQERGTVWDHSVDKLDLEGILNYNLGLWLLVKITKLSLSLRIAERDLLLEKF